MIGRRGALGSRSAAAAPKRWRSEIDRSSSEASGAAGPSKRHAVATSSGDSDAGDSPPAGDQDRKVPTTKGKEKPFAWMDSEDESSAEERKSQSADEAAGRQTGDADARPRRRASRGLADVKTLSDFLAITESLKREARDMSVPQLVTLCATATRLKYYDVPLFREVFKALARSFGGNAVDAADTLEILSRLASLNAYDERVFAAACSSYEGRVHVLSREQRLMWLDILAHVRHQGSERFRDKLRNAPVGVPEESRAEPKLPCRQFMRGFCALGRGCSLSHDPDLAPPRISSPTVQTQCQFNADRQMRLGRPPFAARAAAPSDAGAAGRSMPSDRPPGPSATPRPRARRPEAPPSDGSGPRRPPMSRTKLCVHYSAGTCSWGSGCHFLHAIPRPPVL